MWERVCIPLHPCGQMELQAVASVVIQKVNDMLPDEITDKKVIVKELEKLQRKTADADKITVKKVIVKALEKLQKIADADDITDKKVIVKALEKLQRKIADTDEEQRNSKEFKSWAGECLKSLYDVEDTVESFALGIARQNKKGGFIMKHFPVFKNFKAGQNLRSKMKRIPSNIERLIHIYPTPLHPCGQIELQEVASVVIQKVNGMLPDEITDKKVIVEALEKLQRKIADTDEEQRNSKEFKSWAEECLKSLYDVEDTVESFALGIVRQNKKGGFLMKHFPVFKNFKAGQNLRRKMKRINSNIERVIHIYPKGTKEQHGCSNVTNTSLDGHNSEDSEDTKVNLLSAMEHRNSRELTRSLSNRSLRLEHEKEAKLMHRNISLRCSSDMSLRLDRKEQPKLLHTDSYHDGELEMFTIRQEVDDLVERLTQKDNKGKVLIIQITGKMGSGKTTSARAVYGSRKVKNHFKSGCAWVTISKESNQSEVLQNLLKQVDSKDYLIVLDDVQSDQTWEWLKSLDHQNGSTRLLITTIPKCFPNFPRNVKSHTHNVKMLSEKYSWSLFLKKAGWEEGMEHQDLKQRVLNVCCGLPLNTVLLGSMLSIKKSENRLDYLQKILHSQKKWKTEDIISLSYTDLPYHLKLCVLYLVLFPKEYDIPVRRLLRLWLSEGFVKCKPNIFPEDVVQKNFDDLVQWSLIQISKLASDGSPKRCRLQGVLHDYLLPKAENISLFHFHSTSSGEDSVPPNVRRLVEHASSENVYTDATHLEHLRSYLSFNFQRKDIPAKEVGSLLSHIITKGFGLLRVLDLEGVYKPSLPENLGDLFLLRYLGLRWTFLDALPSSVGDLPYLETLDVKHTNINKLSTSIWKLKHLRHLNLSHIRLDMPKHSDCGSLPELLTLWGLSVDDKSPVKNGLDQLHNLREAGITFCLSNCEDLLNWVSGLTSLQSLRLRSKNDIGHPSHFGDKPLSLSSLSNLSHLNLLGELPKLPENLPEGLKVVTLSLSKLTEDPMPILGKLRQLNVLRLLSDSYMGKKLVCPQGGFEELRVLNLWMLKNLEEWKVEGQAMGKLNEINIRCCDKLMSIPSKLMEQKSLKELVITNMPKEFIQYVDKFTRIQKVILTRKDYDFTPLPWEHADHTCDRFRSMASHTNE